MKEYVVAIVGSTGRVGFEILKILIDKKFPAKKIICLASSNSEGKILNYGGRIFKVQQLDNFDFSGVDFVLSSPGARVSSEFAPRAKKQGCIIIDNTSHFRMDEDVPLVVPEVNPQDAFKNSGIIANPNCSTIQMVVALKPLHDVYKIKRIIVSTYQSVSGSGQKGILQLKNEMDSFISGRQEELGVYPKKIFSNVIPQIDVFMDDFSTKEEWKMRVETQKILDPNIKVHANCARVPVFTGHSEYINIETEKRIDVQDAKSILKRANGVVLIEEGYLTAAEIEGRDEVFVSRLRQDKSIENGLSLWCVSDNIRKGAALNSVQIAELLIGKMD